MKIHPDSLLFRENRSQAHESSYSAIATILFTPTLATTTLTAELARHPWNSTIHSSTCTPTIRGRRKGCTWRGHCHLLFDKGARGTEAPFDKSIIVNFMVS